jgi:acylpyruvate hydrolase
MKLATVRLPGGETQAARLEGDELVLIDALDAAAALANPDALAEDRRIPLNGTSLAPPSTQPSKIICLGLNYESHIKEMGRELPTHPTLFAKFARSLIGAQDPIVLPRVSNQMDWEVELAFVIARPARRVTGTDARDAIGGYTVLNDISARDYQWRTTQWLAGKTFEATTPCGPVVVTPDEIDHAADLEVRCEIDGEVVQRARTSDLVFGPEEIVSYVSEIVTLEPGDIISTGTPGGVGAGRDPQVFLRPGQEVRTVIESIGELRNVCEAEAG